MRTMIPRSKWHKSLTDEVIMDAVQRSHVTTDNPGFCVVCGAKHSCEPDARNYTCDRCEAEQVFGAEELLLYL